MKTHMLKNIEVGWCIVVIIVLAGCSTFAATNVPLSEKAITTRKAQFDIEQDRGSKQKSLVILALSGGGSRAAVLSSSVMLELERIFADDELNILEEVDVISSVSGGSLPAAYYAISQDPGTKPGEVRSGRDWDDNTVKNLMRRNYVAKWFGNWFWPNNIAKYWFTSYDRSDIMAQTFADNLFDSRFLGRDLKFADINPERPYLIINSTNGTAGEFSEVFTFTSDDFTEHTASDIYEYGIARAVMASASFPAVFNFMTLHDHRPGRKGTYAHQFDGGNADNLGLISAERIIAANNEKYERIVVILVDAYVPSRGVGADEADARSLFSFFVDLNFVDSSNSLLDNNRANLLHKFRTTLGGRDPGKTVFYHVKIEDVPDRELRDKLNAIATDFRIKDADADAIEKATKSLIVKENTCLQRIRRILIDGEADAQVDVYCVWSKSASL